MPHEALAAIEGDAHGLIQRVMAARALHGAWEEHRRYHEALREHVRGGARGEPPRRPDDDSARVVRRVLARLRKED